MVKEIVKGLQELMKRLKLVNSAIKKVTEVPQLEFQLEQWKPNLDIMKIEDQLQI
jgi:hypothetical protein